MGQLVGTGPGRIRCDIRRGTTKPCCHNDGRDLGGRNRCCEEDLEVGRTLHDIGRGAVNT